MKCIGRGRAGSGFSSVLLSKRIVELIRGTTNLCFGFKFKYFNIYDAQFEFKFKKKQIILFSRKISIN